MRLLLGRMPERTVTLLQVYPGAGLQCLKDSRANLHSPECKQARLSTRVCIRKGMSKALAAFRGVQSGEMPRATITITTHTITTPAAIEYMNCRCVYRPSLS